MSEPEGTHAGGAAGSLVSLRGVRREFATGPTTVSALNGVDLELRRGDYLAVTGSSGAGKSTLLSILGLLDRPSRGDYVFDGVDTAGFDERQRAGLRATRIGFVFQSFHLLAGRTVAENVALAFVYGDVPRADRRRLAAEAIDRVGLAARAGFVPGLLSGGERQRVAIARAVCTRPALLLADEPTGNLDRRNADAVMALFDELNGDGLAIAMITHDPVVAQRAQRRAVLAGGRLVEEDQPS